ncbi:hypothetical protein KUV64_13940 [Mameliella alba]|uniref:hypothetical protein n=1 Tax=Mameliella TaxID=1434019 RepID=UPI001C973291|nr:MULTISPECIES: hypothetical protein [Mameliella]MBY6120234.1 hypothetical protein [Mameliella alba]MDD9733131.1 hypothetical protein [Mameliella sp. AT18]
MIRTRSAPKPPTPEIGNPPAKAATYRIREARVSHANGNTIETRRMFIAERRVRVLRLLDLWWPVTNGRWRHDSAGARWDAERDAELRSPLTAPLYFTLKS